MAKQKGAARRDPNRALTKRFKGDQLFGLESGFVVYQATLGHPTMKRLFARHFDRYQRALHTVSVVGRLQLSAQDISAAERALDERLDALERYCADKAAQCEQLCQENALRGLRLGHLAPLSVEARVISPRSRRFLQVMLRLDELLSQTTALAIEGILPQERADHATYEVRKQITRTVEGAVSVAVAVWRRVKSQPAGRPGQETGPAATPAVLPSSQPDGGDGVVRLAA